ncbi:MAG: hypothetical protein JW947_10465 [Sedimentisphaerales bacterium]|nr:hypothetical protein [Sedimentisphaerales bacterium]
MALKGGGSASIPRPAQIVMLQFQDALEQGQWATALSLCTEDVNTASKKWDSPEVFFRETVPVDIVLKLRNFPFHAFKSERDNQVYELYIPLTETNFEPVIIWDCSMRWTDGVWRIHFPPEKINLQEMIAQKKKQIEAQEKKLKQLRNELEPKLRGIKTHLSAVSDEFIVGRPMIFRLELMNYGEHSLIYGDQQVAVNGSMTVLDENYNNVPYIGSQCQTAGGPKELKPNSTVVLFEGLDINRQYAIRRQGTYWVQFNGKSLHIGQKSPSSDANDLYRDFVATTTEFPSNRLRIEVKERSSR